MPPYEGQRPFVAFGDRPMTVMRQAYAVAVRNGSSSVGTLDLLCRVAPYQRSVPPWLFAGANGANLMRIVADPRRLPAGRSVGELVTQPVGEFDAEVRAALREVEWSVHRRPDRRGRADPPAPQDRPTWTNGARVALTGALRAARDGQTPFANLSHLVLGILELPTCDGTRYVFPYEHARTEAVDRLRTDPAMRRADDPHPDLDVERLAVSPGAGSLGARLAGRLFARMSRLSRLGPVLAGVDVEARRQAVRLGHGVIGPPHMLLALLTHDDTLAAARIPLTAEHASRNRGAAVLRAHGVDADRLRDLASRRGAPEEPPAEALTEQLGSLRPGDPFTGTDVTAAMARAMEMSLAHRHPDTGTSHLLLALVEDDAGEAAAILRELGVDPESVRARVEQDLRTAPTAWA
ncbi:Clp protease N-terminal domain-containing protein [Micromonospora sediminicola]|uniref:Clp protease N-terminal domain-containing protein n=1 Tax=Micromonospora sediminicola TaxID=946078 RepID=UPI0033C98FF5